MYSVIKEYNSSTKLAENGGRFFILKRISLDDVETVKRLMGINNINVVRFVDIITLDGCFYAVEEYINGITVSEYVRRKGALSEEEAVNITAAVCNGLASIHESGIVHRDINPNNIMLDSYGVTKIIDFGISRTSKAEKQSDTRILGTQGYAAPEQYGFSQTNSKADIYSVGVLLNYLLTLSLPNEKIAQGRFGEIVRRCTQIDEVNRYRNARDLSNDLLYGRPGGRNIIPGFRSGVTWKKVLASLYYVFVTIIFIGFISTPYKDGQGTPLYWGMFVFFLLFVPVPIFTNFLDWVNRLRFTRYMNEGRKRSVPIVAGMIYEFIVFFIFIIVDMN